MYSRVATINVSTADEYIVSNRGTSLFFLFKCYLPFNEQVNNKFPPAECADELLRSLEFRSLMNSCVLRHLVLSNLTKYAWLFFSDKAKHFIFK